MLESNGNTISLIIDREYKPSGPKMMDTSSIKGDVSEDVKQWAARLAAEARAKR